MSIMIPQRKQNSMSQVGTLVGGGVGAYFGGPSGAVEGAQKGAAIGGMADNLTGGKNQPPQLGAMQRRMESSPAVQPGAQIQQAESALAYLPPEQQQSYGAIFRRARAMDQGVA